MSSWRLTVDGQTFLVTARPGTSGAYDFTWLTGPNPGYGFTSQRSNQQEMDAGEFEGVIRNFLAQVEPRSGYIK